MVEGFSSVTAPNGRRLYVDASDRRGASLLRHAGVMYPQSLQIWNEALGLLDSWDVVADVGANYGEMLVGSQMPPTGRVVAFEPNPTVAQFLKKTIEGLPWRTEIVEAAVAASPGGTTSLLVDTSWSGTSHIAEAAEAGLALTATPGRFQSISVRVTNLDETVLADGLRSACIKIDVEGAEISVLRGATRLLAEVPRVAVLMEVLHIAVDDLHDLTKRFRLYLLDLQEGRLARWDGNSAVELGRALHSGRYWHQDAVLLAGSDEDFLDGVAATTASVADFIEQKDAVEQDLEDAQRALGVAQRELGVARRQLAESREERSRLVDAVAAANRRADQLGSELSASREQTSGLRREVERMGRQVGRAERAVAEVHASASWRVTMPLRSLARLVKRIQPWH